MPQLITFGTELIRVNPATSRIEYSTNSGRTWNSRYSGTGCGAFRDLTVSGDKLIALTDRGIYASSNRGFTWASRNTGNVVKDFVAIQSSGRELLAQTSSGHLFYSTNDGLTWNRRR